MPGIRYIETLPPTLELFTRARGFNEFLKYALATPPNVNDVESMTQFRRLEESRFRSILEELKQRIIYFLEIIYYKFSHYSILAS